MLYEKPAMRQLVVTDSPICTNHPELVEGRPVGYKIVNKFGPQANSMRAVYADCPCICPCPCTCMCQCRCTCLCTCQCTCPNTSKQMMLFSELPREEISGSFISQKALKLSDNYKFRKEFSGGLLFNKVTWDTKKLNDTGLIILQFLNGELTSNGIATKLSKLYGIASELILPDVEQFLRTLQSFGVAYYDKKIEK